MIVSRQDWPRYASRIRAVMNSKPDPEIAASAQSWDLVIMVFAGTATIVCAMIGVGI